MRGSAGRRRSSCRVRTAIRANAPDYPRLGLPRPFHVTLDHVAPLRHEPLEGKSSGTMFRGFHRTGFHLARLSVPASTAYSSCHRVKLHSINQNIPETPWLCQAGTERTEHVRPPSRARDRRGGRIPQLRPSEPAVFGGPGGFRSAAGPAIASARRRNRVEAARMERMAFADALHAEPQPSGRTVRFDRFQSVLGTGRIKPAGGRLERRQPSAVKLDRQHNYALYQ